jgi:amino acid transporter
VSRACRAKPRPLKTLRVHSKVAARGIFTSAVATGGCGLAATILFLFCTPPLDVFFEFLAPQPFVQVYALALGKGPSVFMTVLAVIGLILNTSIAIVAASRLIFAVARDGVLPGSSWIGRVTEDGRPKNAVTVMGVFGAVLLCTILPSNVAFTSLISAGAIRETIGKTVLDYSAWWLTFILSPCSHNRRLRDDFVLPLLLHTQLVPTHPFRPRQASSSVLPDRLRLERLHFRRE